MMQSPSPGDGGFSDTSSGGSLLDETDREVRSLTDKAFRSLCVGEEAIYNDSDLGPSSPCLQRDRQNPQWDVCGDGEDKSLEEDPLSYFSNGATDLSLRHQRSRSRVSSLIRAFNSEGGAVMEDQLREWNDEARWNRPDLMNMPSPYQQNVTNGHFSMVGHFSSQDTNFYPTEAAGVPHMNAASSFMGLSHNNYTMMTQVDCNTNFFIHSEFSPFRVWRDHNRFQQGEVSRHMHCSEFPKWNHTPMYKELSLEPQMNASSTFQERSGKHHSTMMAPVVPNHPLQSISTSTRLQKASALEKRCESEQAVHYPHRMRTQSLGTNRIPTRRPSTASPTVEMCRHVQETLSSVDALHQQIKIMTEQNNNAGMTDNRRGAFRSNDTLLPVTTDRNAANQSSSTLSTDGHMLSPQVPMSQAEPPESKQKVGYSQVMEHPPVRAESRGAMPDVRMSSYKSRASSLLFNLKDNRKRVKSTYSPAKFKGCETTEKSRELPLWESKDIVIDIPEHLQGDIQESSWTDGALHQYVKPYHSPRLFSPPLNSKPNTGQVSDYKMAQRQHENDTSNRLTTGLNFSEELPLYSPFKQDVAEKSRKENLDTCQEETKAKREQEESASKRRQDTIAEDIKARIEERRAFISEERKRAQREAARWEKLKETAQRMEEERKGKQIEGRRTHQGKDGRRTEREGRHPLKAQQERGESTSVGERNRLEQRPGERTAEEEEQMRAVLIEEQRLAKRIEQRRLVEETRIKKIQERMRDEQKRERQKRVEQMTREDKGTTRADQKPNTSAKPREAEGEELIIADDLVANREEEHFTTQRKKASTSEEQKRAALLMDALQYYTISSKDKKPKERQTLSPLQEKKHPSEPPEDSGSHRRSHGPHAPPSPAPPLPRSNTSSPALGAKMLMFRVKDNTRGSSFTKSVKPRFHKNFAEESRVGLPTEGKAERRGNEQEITSRNTGTPVHRDAIAGLNRLTPINESSVSQPASTSQEYSAPLPHHRPFSRRSVALDDDDSPSVISNMSEDVQSFATSAADVADLRGLYDYERPVSACSFSSDMSRLGKPPAVPPKSDKALRRAQRLTTRRIRKEVTQSATTDPAEKPQREASSRPASASTELTLDTHREPALTPHFPCLRSSPVTQYHVESSYPQSYPLTQHKVLQDLGSGRYFLVDAPIEVKTKTFFDPETGKYVQLNVRQSGQNIFQPHLQPVLTQPLFPHLNLPPQLQLKQQPELLSHSSPAEKPFTLYEGSQAYPQVYKSQGMSSMPSQSLPSGVVVQEEPYFINNCKTNQSNETGQKSEGQRYSPEQTPYMDTVNDTNKTQNTVYSTHESFPQCDTNQLAGILCENDNSALSRCRPCDIISMSELDDFMEMSDW
uniref:DUF4585 domain-containing protein n=1 Tax=Hippocampus comes TaxID=109280 RepID=A0A3Q2YS32_HIPCM